MKFERLNDLQEKLISVRLREQKTIVSNGYNMTFYFSQDIDGNNIWWWDTYKQFFNDDIREPKNIFHFGLLIAYKENNPDDIYLVSLGKSHFYLSKYIEKDFGIRVAVRMAQQDTILLKKSRYFTGSKRQEISSYEKFIKDSYEPGESVEHLKIKAANSEIWGERNIIFANSIQMNSEKSPTELTEIFNQIESALTDDEIIKLPKLETITDSSLIDKLDAVLLQLLKEHGSTVNIEEFTVQGINFCFKFLEYDYQIYTRDALSRKTFKKDLGHTIEISSIFDYLNEFSSISDINDIRIRFSLEGEGRFSTPLKEVIDFYVQENDITYFLKNGDWCSFNDVFTDYLKRSLNEIEITQHEPLLEADYLAWKTEKESQINQGLSTNKITYREYYFNQLIAQQYNFEVLDRALTQIQSLESGKRKYKVEVADLYKDEEIIAVKISQNEKELIYNIEQSKTSIELIKQNSIDFQLPLKSAALWFVFQDEISRITEFNSIQFLLAVESWKKKVQSYKLKPKIYISHHKLENT